MTFGERLKAAMDRRGINAYQLAQASGVPPIGVSRALRDERTHQEHTTVAKWARVCGVRAEWLSLGDVPMVEAAAATHLRDRREWRSVAAQVRLAHREIAAADVEAVGNLMDDGWPARLDAPLVATIAAARRAWLTRSEAPEE